MLPNLIVFFLQMTQNLILSANNHLELIRKTNLELKKIFQSGSPAIS